jgi:hypothetical protein
MSTIVPGSEPFYLPGGLDGMDHALVCDPKRQVVFDAVEGFLTKAQG